MLVEDSALADAVSLLLVLVPQFEVDSVFGVVVFPVSDSVGVHFALSEALNVHILVKLRSLPHGNPVKSKAVLERVTDWNVVGIKLEAWEGLGLDTCPLEEIWFVAVVTQSLHIVALTVKSIIVDVWTAHKFESSEDESVIVKVWYNLLSKLDLFNLVSDYLTVLTG